MSAPKGNQNATKYWIGRTYGWLTVIGHAGYSDSGRRILWCRCACGKDLLRGKDSLKPKSSCGCHKVNRGNPKKLGWTKKGLEATESPSVRDITWAAGIFEGEGWFNYTDGTRGRSPCLQLGITQKDPWILYRVQRLFGGSVRQRNLIRVSITPDGKEHFRDTYDWYVSGSRARGLLMTIWLFLSPRRHEKLLSKGFRFRRS